MSRHTLSHIEQSNLNHLLAPLIQFASSSPTDDKQQVSTKITPDKKSKNSDNQSKPKTKKPQKRKSTESSTNKPTKKKTQNTDQITLENFI